MNTGGGIPDPPVWGDIGNLPIYEPEGEGGDGWSIYKNEFYVRGVGGNELAIYNFDQLEQWNVYGTDNVGKITKDGEEENKFYYLKDHLGSIRAVINEDNEVVNAQDYDMWGYLLENRTFNIDKEKYKFTGKERDDESSYDYFGARYYMSRIGRWGGVDVLFERNYSESPYSYSSNDPINRIDIGGEWDVTVHVYHDRDQHPYGIAVVTDRDGVEVFKFYVSVVSVKKDRNRMNEDADTPLGVYNIPKDDTWRPSTSKYEKGAFGPYHRLVLEGESGEIKESKRFWIRIHGGRQAGLSLPKQLKDLKPTKGCMRAFDEDMKKFKNITDELEANDPDEMPGKVYVKDDLLKEGNQFIIPRLGPAKAVD